MSTLGLGGFPPFGTDRPHPPDRLVGESATGRTTAPRWGRPVEPERGWIADDDNITARFVTSES